MSDAVRLTKPPPDPSARRAWHAVGLGAWLALALLEPAAAGAQSEPAAFTAKTAITRADQLPRRTYSLPRLPSEILEGPAEDLLRLADPLERDLLADLARFDIQDQATLRGLVSTRMNIAALRGDWTAIGPLAAQLRTLQDKPVTNLAAKLFALDPRLSATQVKAMILAGAERQGGSI